MTTGGVDAVIAASAQQVRVLACIRQRLARRWIVSRIMHDVQREHASPERGSLAPAEVTWFSVSVPPFAVTVSTPSTLAVGPTEAIELAFLTYESGRRGQRWALLEDAATRRALDDLGFGRSAVREATWALHDGAEAEVVDAIVRTIERLATLPHRVLRPEDLPPDAPWPSPAIVCVLAADDVRQAAASSPSAGHIEIVADTGGERTRLRVREADWRLVQWWRRRAIRPSTESQD